MKLKSNHDWRRSDSVWLSIYVAIVCSKISKLEKIEKWLKSSRTCNWLKKNKKRREIVSDLMLLSLIVSSSVYKFVKKCLSLTWVSELWVWDAS